jgi:hypothetical protein
MVSKLIELGLFIAAGDISCVALFDWLSCRCCRNGMTARGTTLNAGSLRHDGCCFGLLPLFILMRI